MSPGVAFLRVLYGTWGAAWLAGAVLQGGHDAPRGGGIHAGAVDVGGRGAGELGRDWPALVEGRGQPGEHRAQRVLVVPPGHLRPLKVGEDPAVGGEIRRTDRRPPPWVGPFFWPNGPWFLAPPRAPGGGQDAEDGHRGRVDQAGRPGRQVAGGQHRADDDHGGGQGQAGVPHESSPASSARIWASAVAAWPESTSVIGCVL